MLTCDPRKSGHTLAVRFPPNKHEYDGMLMEIIGLDTSVILAWLIEQGYSVVVCNPGPI